MREDIKALIQSRRHCVLATAYENQPYCSLMAYAASPDSIRIYMVTSRDSRKFRNLKENPRASLLIDSRDLEAAQALTIEGGFEEINTDAAKKEIRKLLLADHPQLKNFTDQPDAGYICIHLRSLIFLNGLTDAYYETIG